MARRRQAIGSAIQRAGDDFVQMFFERQREEREAQRQQERIRQQEEAASRQQRAGDERTLLRDAMVDPSGRVAARLLQQGRSSLGGETLKPLSDDDALGEVFEGVGRAKTRPDLPTREELMAAARARGVSPTSTIGVAPGMDVVSGRRPAIEDLLVAREAREKVLTAEERKNLTKISGVDESGAAYEEHVPTVDLPSRGRIPTSPSATRQGELTGQSQLATLQTPGLLQAESRRAGAIAGAQENAQLSVYHSAKFTNARIQEHLAKAVADAAQAGNAAAAKDAQEAAKSATMANMVLDQVQTLYDQVKLDPGFLSAFRQVGRAVGSKTGTLAQVNPVAAQLDALADGLTMVVYRAVGGTGANISDRDLERIDKILPKSYILSTTGDKTIAELRRLLTYGSLLTAKYSNLDVSSRLDIAAKWAELEEKGRAAGVTSFEDPFTPGTLIRIK